MNPEEYSRMHALETDYWWFVGRRAIIGALVRDVVAARQRRRASDPSLQLLDIGCGTGANLPLLSQLAGAHGWVTGVDFSPLALQFARDHLGVQRVSLSQGDALHLPFADASFDLVTMLDVLEHISDDRCALAEVRRVLRPGGALVWSVPAYMRLWSAHDEALHHFRRYEFHDLRHLLHSSGFEVRRLSFAMSMMPPIAYLWRRCVLPFLRKQPRDATRHSQGAVLPPAPGPFNHALIAYLAMEGRLIVRRPLRFGTSLVGIAVKPE